MVAVNASAVVLIAGGFGPIVFSWSLNPMLLMSLSLLHTQTNIFLKMAYSTKDNSNSSLNPCGTIYTFDITPLESTAIEQAVRTIMQSSSAVRLVSIEQRSPGDSVALPVPFSEIPGRKG